MKPKISTGVLIFKNKKLLLIKHVNPKTGYTWWVPPGGGIKGAESIFEAALREVWEETGTKVELDRIVYLRQLIYREQEQNVLTIYLLAKNLKGSFTLDNIKCHGMDEHYIKEIKFFDKKEIQKINVFPKELRTILWDDYTENFPNIKFLGVELDQG
ncbi:MAG: NUDIX hydrolase [archaeon]